VGKLTTKLILPRKRMKGTNLSEPKSLKPPTATSGDAAHLAARLAVSAVPGFGGPALELFNAIIAPPLERRRNEWMEHVAEAFETLRGRVERLEDLQNNEAFIDAFIQASRIAVSNNQQEKIEALKNAIINSGISQSVDRSVQQIFLAYVDDFTVWHLKILKLVNDPPEKFGDYSMNPGVMQGSFDMILRIFPELQGKDDFFRFIWKDLYLKGLVSQEHLHVTPGNRHSRITTDYGSKFVSFIEKPAKA